MMDTISSQIPAVDPKDWAKDPRVPKKKEKTSDGKDGDFSSKVAAAMPWVAQAPAPKMAALALKMTASPKSVPSQSGEAQQVRVQSSLQPGGQASPQLNGTLLTQQTASENAKAAVAGLKPWARDWIFEGRESPVSALKTDYPVIFPGATAQGVPQVDQRGPRISGSPEAPSRGSRGDAAAGPRISEEGLMAVLAKLRANEGGERPKLVLERDPSGRVHVREMIPDQLDPVALRENAPAVEMYVPPQHQEHVRNLPNGVISVAPSDAIQTVPAMQPLQPAQTGLSGSEYLTTLNAIRNPNSRFSENLNSGGDQEGSRNGGRPDLRVIEGASKDLRKHGSEDTTFLMNPSVTDRGAWNPHHLAPLVPGYRPEVSGYVTQGAMARDRLSSEALLGLSQGIRNLTPNGGGEIRVRLKPENLGELQVKVTSLGNNDVGLRIQASDERAKSIIEESLSHLKESLAGKHLTLTSVDVTVAQAAGNAGGGDFRQDLGGQQAQGQSFSQNGWSQNARQGNQSGSDRWGGFEPNYTTRSNLRTPEPAMPRSFARSGVASNGRLDVRA